jgi:hypothetical protein
MPVRVGASSHETAERQGDPTPARARPLRIGLMLRAVDEYDGAGVYIRQLCDALFKLDRFNEYVVFYMRENQLGRYAHVPNVKERLVTAPGKLLWDQVYLPRALPPQVQHSAGCPLSDGGTATRHRVLDLPPVLHSIG